MFSRGKSGRGRQGGHDPAHDRVLPWQASQRQIYYREDPEFRKQPRGLLEDGSRWQKTQPRLVFLALMLKIVVCSSLVNAF